MTENPIIYQLDTNILPGTIGKVDTIFLWWSDDLFTSDRTTQSRLVKLHVCKKACCNLFMTENSIIYQHNTNILPGTIGVIDAIFLWWSDGLSTTDTTTQSTLPHHWGLLIAT